ncbi:MAG TPA: TlpA disulfide reductase family protein [bacterium]|nr:TlpA disulfide reductase family protein [bacterium]HPN44498.1 TlpA disulfide reductase family protein [bacterium]
MKNNFKLVTLALLALFVLAVISCKGTGKTEVKQPAFEFSVSGLNGNSISLDNYKGKVLLLDFWDTWCPPCKAEIPHFIELYSQYQGEGLEILGVAFGREGTEALTSFIAEYQINYPNALANEEIVNGFGDITSIPTTFLIDRNGNIYKKYVGYQDKSVFETDIKALL